MTTKSQPPTAPGCWGSAIFYRKLSAECSICVHHASCVSVVRSAERVTLCKVALMDAKFGTSKASYVTNWLKGRYQSTPHEKISKERQARIASLLHQWRQSGVNPFDLLHRVNPTNIKGGKLWYEVFKFILNAGHFKPKDIVDELAYRYRSVDKNELSLLVRDICDALLSEAILVKDKGILCLK